MTRSLRSLAGLFVAAALFSACRSNPGDPTSHWNVDSMDERIVKRFTGYRGPIDGSYVRFQAEKKAHVNKTLRRHFLHNNPDNPFQVADPTLGDTPPAHGLLPNPIGWFGAEGVLLGGVAAAWSGSFIPVPLDSVFALMTPDGRDEFARSLSLSDSGSTPPSPDTFEVKRR